jgi:hypothetical protein
MAGSDFASKQKVERLESELENLRSAMEAQAALFIELRDQVAPTDPYLGLAMSASAGSNPAIRNGRVFDGSVSAHEGREGG